jgi:phosphomannomutase
MEVERDGETTFVFGYEEALGYSVGTVARDKDGVSGAAVFAELAAEAASRGQTVLDELEALYRRFGLYLSKQVSITRKGAEGLARIGRTMDSFRKDPPAQIGGLAVEAIRDYKARTVTRPGGASQPLALPASNVITYELAGGSRIILRPSGTEPKIKYYFDVREAVVGDEPLAEARRRGEAVVARLVADFSARADAVA